MKRLGILFVLYSFIAASPTVASDHLDRALVAMGGAEALAKLKTLALKGTVRQFDPEQAFVPGGESRHTNNSEFEMTADVAAKISRTDWVKNFLYPYPVKRTFSEIVTPQAGYVIGVDTLTRNKQSLDNYPPAHAMSGLRLATTQRELLRASPGLLLEMKRHRSDVRAHSDVTVGGVRHPALDYQADNVTYTIMFDLKTGLPARIRTADNDNVWGDVSYDLVLSDWRLVDGIRIAARHVYELRGKLLQEVQFTQLTVNPAVDAARFEPPTAIKAGAAKPAAGHPYHQWVIRRQFIGTYVDSDNVSFDTRATQGLRLDELAPGVQFEVGGSHNSLIVEMSDHLIVFDAPVSDEQSRWTLAAAKVKYPGKTVRFVVLTHHHMDHVGGIRAFVAQGATLVVGKGAAQHFREVLAAPYTRNPDLAVSDLSRANIVEVADKHVFSDGRREVAAYLIDNPHAQGMLIGYVADQRIGFVTDLWAPGAPLLPPKMNPLLASLVNGVKKAGIAPARFAGGHGSVAPYAPLEALAAADQSSP